MKIKKSINEAIREADKDLDNFLQGRLSVEDYHDVADKINGIVALNIRAYELLYEQRISTRNVQNVQINPKQITVE